MKSTTEIIAADFSKNHQGRSYDCTYVQDIFAKYAELGLLYFRTDSVMIVYEVKDGCVEFHCMNGGTGADLTSAINRFLEDMSQEFDVAATYYDNPRINELVKYSKYPATVRRIDGGEDRTFEMTFNLRGEQWVQ